MFQHAAEPVGLSAEVVEPAEQAVALGLVDPELFVVVAKETDQRLADGPRPDDVDDPPLEKKNEGVKQLAKIIYTLHDEAKDKPFELEMSWLCEGSGWKHVGVPKGVIAEATAWAKKEIEEAEEEESEEEDDEMEE